MKTLTSQSINHHQDLLKSHNTVVPNKKYNSKQKFFLVAKALKEFHQDIAIPYALCAKALIIILVLITTAISFSALLVRALDIEAEERQQILLNHEQFLKIKLKNDAPQEKGER